ncbi:MAG: hypothetical protein U0T36_01995 [Saprospiraceae bacterium]|jgi:hypothetical protein
MKSILIIILFSSKILFAQQISYFRQHTNDIIECLFKKPFKIEMASHLSKCMKGKVFPEFCIEDRNNHEWKTNMNCNLFLLTFLKDNSKEFIDEIVYINSLNLNSYNLNKIVLISEDEINANVLSNQKIFNSWNIVDNSAKKPIARSQYGYPLTIVCESNGIILGYYLMGVKSDPSFKKDLLKLLGQ